MGRTNRSIVAVSGLLLCLVGGTGIVAADTPLSHTGDPGRHYLADNRDNPGVKCFYNDDLALRRVRVRAPFIYARDVSPEVDSQLVGWQIIVQRAPIDDGAWKRVARSSIITVVANDNAPAAFADRSLRFIGNGAGIYRVVVKMLWYEAPDGAYEGTAKHRFDWYTGAAFTPSIGPNGYCPGAVF